jgi:STE24 endopeptidase
MLTISLVNSGIIFFLLSLVLGKYSPVFAAALGSENPSFQFSLIVFGVLYTPISTVLGIGINVMSRKNEYEADAFAKEHGLARPLGKALKKLSVTALSNLNPHPAYVFFHYSHPTILQRLQNLNK